jgi:chromosome partitioning protein
MGFVVAVAQQKGGAGKSTVAANLAVALAADGTRVALLDTDPQQSLARWWEERANQSRATPLSFETPAGWRIPAAIDRLKRDHAFILLDTAPHAETEAKIAIRAADLVLLPMQPSPADLWASDATLRLAEQERRRAMVLLNRVPASGKLPGQIEAELAKRGVPVLAQKLGNRTAYASSFMNGLAVCEAAPRTQAAAELNALAAVVRDMGGQQ